MRIHTDVGKSSCLLILFRNLASWISRGLPINKKKQKYKINNGIITTNDESNDANEATRVATIATEGGTPTQLNMMAATGRIDITQQLIPPQAFWSKSTKTTNKKQICK